MTLRDLLEEFRQETAQRSHNNDAVGVTQSQSDAEAMRSESYETGYASGWEDASRSAEEGRKKIDAEFARNIQDLGFTFHEAASQVRGEFTELLNQMLDSFFPVLLPEILREIVREHLRPMIEDASELPVQIVASPDAHSTMTELLDGEYPFEIELVEEQTLAAHQVFMRFGERETSVDFTALTKALRSQIAAICDLADGNQKHG